MAETLKQLVQHLEIYEQIQNPHVSKDEYIGIYVMDVCTNNPNILLDPRTITLVDEIELCNPLGIASKNKLVCVFFTLGNIHPDTPSPAFYTKGHLRSCCKCAYD